MDKKYEIVYNNACSVVLLTKGEVETIENKKSIEIVSINRKDFISLGDKVKVDVVHNDRKFSTFYIPKEIKEVSKNKFLLKEFLANTVTDMCLPLLRINKNNLLFNFHFCGAYNEVGKHQLNKQHDILFLVYRWTPFEHYERYIEWFISEYKCEDVFKSNDSRFDIIAIKAPSIFKFDLIKIYNSDYLEITDLAKQTIMKFHEDPTLNAVFRNDPNLRKNMEKVLNASIPDHIPLYPKFDIENSRLDNE